MNDDLNEKELFTCWFVGALLGAMLDFGGAAWFIIIFLLLFNWTCLQDVLPGRAR